MKVLPITLGFFLIMAHSAQGISWDAKSTLSQAGDYISNIASNTWKSIESAYAYGTELVGPLAKPWINWFNEKSNEASAKYNGLIKAAAKTSGAKWIFYSLSGLSANFSLRNLGQARTLLSTLNGALSKIAKELENVAVEGTVYAVAAGHKKELNRRLAAGAFMSSYINPNILKLGESATIIGKVLGHLTTAGLLVVFTMILYKLASDISEQIAKDLEDGKVTQNEAEVASEIARKATQVADSLVQLTEGSEALTK